MADDDGPPSIIPSPCDPLHIAQAFALAEFSALRSESDASRTATHSIFSWSLASLSALSTGVGFLITQLDQSSSTQVRFIVYGALAFTLPAIALFSCLAWWGEVMRMSRIGSYLYARERKTWTGNPEKVDGSLSTPSWQSFPMFWEAHIANQTGNLLLAQIGALGIYTVFFVVPLAAFSYLVNNKWWICWPVIAGLSFIAVNVILKGRNQVFTNERYIFSDQKPMSYPSRGGPLQAIFGKLDSTGRLRNSYSADEHGLTTMDGRASHPTADEDGNE